MGEGLNWGPYGKLCCAELPGDALEEQTEQTLLDIDLDNGGLFAGMYLFFDGGDTLPAYLEGKMRFYVDGAVEPVDYDSTEDYFGAGWYFAHGAFATEQCGCAYISGNNVGAYRWHDRDPIQFASELQVSWVVGQEYPVPTENPVTVNGVLWYYEAAAGGAASPTVIKGDTGTTGATGAAGSPGVLARDPVGQHDTTDSPIVLYQAADGSDSSGNSYALTVQQTNPVVLGRGSESIKGFHFPTFQAVCTRSTRTPALDLNGDMTIAFLIRANQSPDNMLVVVDYSGATRNSVSTQQLYTVMFSTNCRMRVQWGYGGTNLQNADFTTAFLPVGEICHFAIVRSGSAPNILVECYRNGVSCGQVVCANAPDGSGFAQALAIGNFYGAANATYALKNTLVSSLAIYGSALNATQVRALAAMCLELP